MKTRAPCFDLPPEQKEWFHGSDYAKAKRVCKRCSLTEKCLEIALEAEQPGVGRFGVYGALTAKERNEMFGRVE